jgi:hypothetical protein
MADDVSQPDNSDPAIFATGGSLLSGFTITGPGLDDASYSAGNNAAQGALDAISPAVSGVAPYLLIGAGVLAIILIAR